MPTFLYPLEFVLWQLIYISKHIRNPWACLVFHRLRVGGPPLLANGNRTGKRSNFHLKILTWHQKINSHRPGVENPREFPGLTGAGDVLWRGLTTDCVDSTCNIPAWKCSPPRRTVIFEPSRFLPGAPIAPVTIEKGRSLL